MELHRCAVRNFEIPSIPGKRKKIVKPQENKNKNYHVFERKSLHTWKKAKKHQVSEKKNFKSLKEIPSIPAERTKTVKSLEKIWQFFSKKIAHIAEWQCAKSQL